MRNLLWQLAARAVLLWVLALYLAAIFGMTVGPAVVAWEWFSPGLPAWIAAALALLAAMLPMMIGVCAMNRGGVWASRPVWRIWTSGWAVFGGALFLSMVLE